jgi:hypothetical protein
VGAFRRRRRKSSATDAPRGKATKCIPARTFTIRGLLTAPRPAASTPTRLPAASRPMKKRRETVARSMTVEVRRCMKREVASGKSFQSSMAT